ncbi:MAG TPA: ATP-binding protein [Phycisphaerae bacterium]|nr:ATP-binding protein [Phycisphaerae bacterium]
MATLVVLHGPDKGRSFQTGDEPAVLGRESDQVPLTDRTVSRHHAEITPDNGGWILRDLRSANGTYVNSMRIRQPIRLKHGDQIKIGSTLLMYTGDQFMPEADRMQAADLIDLDLSSRNLDSAILSTVSSDESAIIAGPEVTQAARAWRVMSELTAAIGAMIDPHQLLERAMDLVIEELPVDRGFILFYDKEGEQLVPEVVRYRRGRHNKQEKIATSQKIIRHVLDHREAVLCTNAMTDTRFARDNAQDSIHNFGLHSVICAPIMVRDLLLGVIHIDCSAAAHSYTQEQLRLMSAIGQMIGLAIQNARLVQQQMKTARLAAVGETVAYLSHGIKNILQAVQSGADLVDMGLKKNSGEMTGKGWGIVQRNIEQIMQMTMNMLSFSKSREPNLHLNYLNRILAQVVADLQPKAREKNVQLTADLEAPLPPMPLDAEGINQVALNLIINAIESVEPDKGQVHVSTQFHPDEGIADLIVSDNGPGIEPERIEELFEPFKSTKGHGGTGLGLPVVRKIVREHHGRTIVESTPGVGTTFRIRLPAQEMLRQSAETFSTVE